jgi:hypothetical protein
MLCVGSTLRTGHSPCRGVLPWAGSRSRTNSGSFWGNVVYYDVIGDSAPGYRRCLPPNTRAQAAVRATRGTPPRQYVPRHPRAQKLPGGRVFARTSFTPMQWTAPNAQSVVRTRWGPPTERSKWCSAWSAKLSTSLFLSEEDHARARLNNIPSSTVYWESNQRSCTSVGCLRQNQQTRKHTAPCCRFSPKLVKKMSHVFPNVSLNKAGGIRTVKRKIHCVGARPSVTQAQLRTW